MHRYLEKNAKGNRNVLQIVCNSHYTPINTRKRKRLYDDVMKALAQLEYRIIILAAELDNEEEPDD